MTSLDLAPHPLLEIAAFTSEFPEPLGSSPSPDWLVGLLSPTAESPFAAADEPLRQAVRRLLRHGGFKPSGRSKPASEYLARNEVGSINPAVDACNVVSLHSGLPISVVDLERARPPFRIAVAPEGSAYVFNPSGQELDLGGLLCLFDAEGPCANAVKDAQRTKTGPETRRTLSVLWGSCEAPGRAAEAAAWYRDLLTRLGATTEPVATRIEEAPRG